MDPVWEEVLKIWVPPGACEKGLEIKVMDKAMFGKNDNVIGKCNYFLEEMRQKTPNPVDSDEVLDLYHEGSPAGKLM